MNERDSDSGLTDDDLAGMRQALDQGGPTNLTPAGRMRLYEANARAIDVLIPITVDL